MQETEPYPQACFCQSMFEKRNYPPQILNSSRLQLSRKERFPQSWSLVRQLHRFLVLSDALHIWKDISLRNLKCQIQTCGNDFARIIDQEKVRMIILHFFDDLTRTVAGHAVCNDNLDRDGQILLSIDMFKASPNILGFVSDGY
jgi:hypothetical protein